MSYRNQQKKWEHEQKTARAEKEAVEALREFESEQEKFRNTLLLDNAREREAAQAQQAVAFSKQPWG